MDSSSDVRPPLPPPTFSLRTLLLAVTSCCVFFGAFWWFSPSIVVAAAVGSMMVAAHVVGNSLGTRLRDRASRPVSQSRDQRRQEVLASQAPATHLGQRSSLGW